MTKSILMQHETTGAIKMGYYGFSWSCLTLAFIPPLRRGDFITTVFGLTVTLTTYLISTEFSQSPTAIMASVGLNIVWASQFNQIYTMLLMQRGYVFAGSPANNARAERALSRSSSLTSFIFRL